MPVDRWRVSRSHRLRSARTVSTAISARSEKENVSSALSLSRLQHEHRAAIFPFRRGRVAALGRRKTGMTGAPFACRLYIGGIFCFKVRPHLKCLTNAQFAERRV